MSRAGFATVLSSLAVLATLAGSPAASAASLSSGSTSLDLGGSLRTIPALVQAPESDPTLGAFDQTLLRGTAVGRLGEVLRLELHAVESITASSGGPASGYAGSSRSATRYRAFGLRWGQADQSRFSAGLEVDRASLRVSLPNLDVTVGRQPINFSKALFFNPLDAFLPFDPRAFDRDYKPGVDAVRLQVALGLTTGLEVVGALGPTLQVDRTVGAVSTQGGFIDATRKGAALLGRVFTTLGHVDLSLQAGKVYGGLVAGLGGAGELFGLGWRSELTVFRVDPAEPSTFLPDGRGHFPEVRLLDDGVSLVVGVERRFESELFLALEVFHNGLAAQDNLILSGARIALGQTQSLSRDLAAVTASYPLTPLWSVSLAALGSLSDGSLLLTPGIKWSAGSELEVLAGALVGLGARPRLDPALGAKVPQTEFGTYPHLLWLEAKLYF